MKNIFRTFATVTVLMFAGCTNEITEDNDQTPSADVTTITLGLDKTKTSLGQLETDGTRKVFWSDNDQIVANGVLSSSVTLSEDKKFAKFSFNDPELATPYNIYYPGNGFKDQTTVTLAAVQNVEKDNIAANCSPMAGVSQDGTSPVSLQHLAAVVRLQVKLPAESTHTLHELSKVEVRGGNNEQMSGDFTIDYQNATLASASNAVADQLVTAVYGHSLSATETANIFIIIPTGDYSAGLKFRLIDSAGHYMDLKSGAKALDGGDIMTMPIIEFVPTDTQIGVEINTAAALVAFAKAYNNGDYRGQSPFVVHITGDIVFDESTSSQWEPIGNVFAADNKLGLEEGTDNYFHGHLEGNGYSIKSWTSSRPLFAYTDASSVIENLNIDESCILSANYSGSNEFFGPFVGYHQGNLLNCVNNADVTVSGTWANQARVGGLVGRSAEGKVYDCTNNGNISFDSDFALTKGTVCAGGIVGYISNPDGKVQSSTNNGTVTVNGAATKLISYVGGIVGACHGVVDNNTNSNTAAVTCNAKSQYVYQGGIVGQAIETGVITDNENYAAVSCTTSATRDDDNGRYIYVGGIAGSALNTVTGNTNNANVTSTSSAKDVHLGGIAGLLQTTDIANNTVASAVVIESQGEPRISGIGGFAGLVTKGEFNFSGYQGTFNCTVKGGKGRSNDTNNANIVAAGGVFGMIKSGEKVVIKNATWTGGLNVVATATTGHYGAAYGGIVGYVYDNNAVTIENSTFEGSVSASFATTDKTTIHMIGGILGGAGANGGVTVKGCCNKTAIDVGNKVVDTKHPVFVGGIVGFIQGGDNTIDDCDNLGYTRTRTNNYTGIADQSEAYANYAGGIIAVYGDHVINNGTEVVTNGTLTIKDCYVSKTVSQQRGFCGGIAGWVRDADISGCIVYPLDANTLIGGNGLSGGVVGVAINSNISNCTVTSKINGVTANNNIGHSGGIVGYLDGQSTVDNCKYYGLINCNAGSDYPTYIGGISAYTSDESTIKNSRFGGSTSSKITFTDDNYASYLYHYSFGTVAGTESAATVTNCSYWDGQ